MKITYIGPHAGIEVDGHSGDPIVRGEPVEVADELAQRLLQQEDTFTEGKPKKAQLDPPQDPTQDLPAE